MFRAILNALLPSPMHGEAGHLRGWRNATAMLGEHGHDSKEAQQWWTHSDPPRDDYDRGILQALKDAGVPDPCGDGPG